MCAISSIPTTRLSNQFMALRVLTQIQSDQRGLFGIQSQLASGRRISMPSEDAPAAARAMTLQSLLERKSSIQVSLGSIQARLSVTESAIGNASSVLSGIRSTALSIIGTAVGSPERAAAVSEVGLAIEQLLSIGNQTYQGGYLFSGSTTQVVPFSSTQQGIVYNGNANSLLAYSDVDQVFASNVTGDDVFGTYSASVRGAVDLNPSLAWNTPLTDLNGGQGVRIGSIAVSDGTSTSIVSLAGAATIGDVARLIETHPPGNREATVRVTSKGLEVSLNGGHLSISEVGGGSTAAELGIKRLNGVGPGPAVGGDLNPQLTLLTRLDDILGSRAQAYLSSTGGHNDLILTAVHAGADLNGVTVKYVDDDWFQSASGVTAGNEFATYHPTATAATTVLDFPGRAGLDRGLQLTATSAGASMNGVHVALNVRAADGLGPQFNYDAVAKTYSMSVEAGTTLSQLSTAISSSGGPFTAAVTPSGNAAYTLSSADTNATAGNTFATGNDAKTLAIHIDSGRTTASQVIAAVAAEGTFVAALDPSEDRNSGSGAVVSSTDDPGTVGVSYGGAGQDFDRTHGLRIVNGGQTYNVDLSQARTVEDLLSAINGAGAGMLATINVDGTGIDVRSRLSGADFSIGENGGSTARQLGIRTLTESSPLAGLNHGAGVRVSQQGDDFLITRRDGTTFGVRLGAGVEASAQLPGAANASLLFSRVAAGTAGNQFGVEIVDSGVGGGDAVSLVGNVLRFSVDVAAGFTAQEAIDLLASDGVLAGQFTAQLDRSTDAANTGAGNLTATASPASFSGGKGAAITLGDVIDLINRDPTNLASGPRVTARLSEFGNGVELVNDGSGTGTLKVSKLNSSTAAVDLGLILPTSETSSQPVAGERASAKLVIPGADNDLVITALDAGTQFNGVAVRFQDDGVAGNNSVSYDPVTKQLTFDVDPTTTTAEDLVQLLNGHPQFQAALTPTDGGAANSGLGMLGALPSDAVLSGGTADVLTGVDANPQQVDGMFTALIRLRDAMRDGDNVKIQLAVDQFDRSLTKITFARADVGARMNSVDVVANRIEVENITLRDTLSKAIETDFADAVSQLALRQASFQASLQVAAQLARTTLLDYL